MEAAGARGGRGSDQPLPLEMNGCASEVIEAASASCVNVEFCYIAALLYRCFTCVSGESGGGVVGTLAE